ncbi:CAP-Gly domain-containing linker protein 3 [Aegotheles albertisi]
MTQERAVPPAGGGGRGRGGGSDPAPPLAPPPVPPPSPPPERRARPIVHPAAPAPLPRDYAFTFFDPNDSACREILLDPRTTVPQLFAILRQWVPQVQHSVDVIGNEILRRGCHVDDRDGLTDMTLLHYACKAGAHGVGDPAAAVRLSTRLLALGGDVGLRSRWTHMNALHYAAYFDVPELIRTLLRAAAPRVLHSTCSDFNHGTALHIAASNLCLGAVRCLLEHGADPAMRNSKGQVAAEVVPDPADMALDRAEAAGAARELRALLLEAVPLSCVIPRVTLPNYDNIPGHVMLLCLGLQLGERVRIQGGKEGTLRFCGTTAFASGQWAGVELDEPEGKNDGSVGGVRYFICPPKQGIFASVSKISKTPPPASRRRGGAWLDREGRRVAPGDAVLVAGTRPGRARFYGRTDFAPGYWFGVELDSAGGKHDGAVFGVRYFSCPPRHGVFAPPSRVTRVGGGPQEEPGGGDAQKKEQPMAATVSQPKRHFPAVRTPKDITSESSFSRLLFCCWFPWMLREMQS